MNSVKKGAQDMARLLFTFFLLLSSFIYCGVEDYLKLPVNKPQEGHSIANVDYIYTINLDERPEKFQHCVEELKEYGITPYRFSAVNGWKLPQEAFDGLGIKFNPVTMSSGMWGTSYLPGERGPHHEIMSVPGRSYFCHCMSKGAIGIVLSHLSILQDAYDSGYETIWVMEDDIEVIRNPHEISQAIEELDAVVGKTGWDILFTDKDTKDKNGNYVLCLGYALRPNFNPLNPEKFAQRTMIHPKFWKIGARYGAYSMIVRRSGMKKILDFIKTYGVFLPFDMEYYLPNDMSIYTVTSDIVSTLPQALSDNGSPGYLQRIK